LEMQPFGIRVVLIEPGDVCNTGITNARRHARGCRNNDAQNTTFLRVLQIIEKEERNGATPERVAATLRTVLTQRNPRLRYTVGHLSQRTAAFAKWLLPWAVFEKILMRFYSCDRPS